ncbi:hypothetical protein K1W54_15455 [Micromonospora sp. CPCC 205371]|nr:hypothetical protein [Micromonospora sp. CPCC 205371]
MTPTGTPAASGSSPTRADSGRQPRVTAGRMAVDEATAARRRGGLNLLGVHRRRPRGRA